jgi:tRNA-2-methylthio-N6-dimethylallyladenosine synthase
MSKSVYIKSYGCQMNVYDSQRMSDVLAKEGYATIDSPEGADLILLNTCHIRERASENVYSELGRMRDIKEASDKPVKIGVAGCMAQAEGAEIMRRAKTVDLVVGTQSYHRLPELLKLHKPVDLDFPAIDKFDAMPAQSVKGLSAFVTIQEGCDKFCTFCVVPYTRGAEVSRPFQKILDEIKLLASKGVKDISLLGQNVNAYHGGVTLAELMAKIASIKGIERLRYTTSHPRDMGDDLIEAHRDNPILMPYLHLPVQSGSDRVLKAMNRGHTSADYLKTIEKAKAIRPDMAFSSDFIVGFPGETDAEFNETLDLVKAVGFSQCYSFTYSTRPGTPGADMVDQIPKAEKQARLHVLQALINAQANDFNEGLLHKTVPVLFEKKGRMAGQIAGRTPYSTPVQIEASEELIGQILSIKLTSRGTFSHFGEVV